MKKKDVISHKNIPTQFRIEWFIVIGLLLDRVGVAGFWMGAYIASVVFMCIIILSSKLILERQLDIFEELRKSPWKSREN